MKVQQEQQTAAVAMQTMLVNTYQRLQTLQLTLKTLESEVLLQTASTFADIKTAYQFGKVSYLDVLEAQRNLFEAKRQFATTKQDCWSTFVLLEFLTGQPLLKI